MPLRSGSAAFRAFTRVHLHSSVTAKGESKLLTRLWPFLVPGGEKKWLRKAKTNLPSFLTNPDKKKEVVLKKAQSIFLAIVQTVEVRLQRLDQTMDTLVVVRLFFESVIFFV